MAGGKAYCRTLPPTTRGADARSLTGSPQFLPKFLQADLLRLVCHARRKRRGQSAGDVILLYSSPIVAANADEVIPIASLLAGQPGDRKDPFRLHREAAHIRPALH